jgi:hypothetical protein
LTFLEEPQQYNSKEILDTLARLTVSAEQAAKQFAYHDRQLALNPKWIKQVCWNPDSYEDIAEAYCQCDRVLGCKKRTSSNTRRFGRSEHEQSPHEGCRFQLGGHWLLDCSNEWEGHASKITTCL